MNAGSGARGATVGLGLWAGAVAVAAVLLTGCSSGESGLDGPPRLPSITVGSGQSAENRVLAEIYAGVLRGTGSPVETRLDLAPGEDLAELDSGAVTLVPEYTGRLLERLHPGAAETEPDAVFEELNRSLPAGLSVSDYGMAQEPGSGDAGEAGSSVPAQNVVPLMRSGVLTEAQVKALNVVAGELTSAELAQMGESVRSGERTADRAAADWLGAR
ncbi:glycine betaine ABC transporter substrate-binding protein [Rhodococcus sp. NPDC127528]|uniref:glycine betaine ABC transporter substrate-binding protein n=1 Tax=unclassified Rhodococcus (in: high G+C Gram-positive bacteria) TaxID=192944 RepID=UPI003632588D